MRVGFLFNHDQVHQVAHSLPIALALARGAADVEVVAATTHPRLSAEVIRLGEGLIGPRIKLIELGLSRPSSRLLAATLRRWRSPCTTSSRGRTNWRRWGRRRARTLERYGPEAFARAGAAVMARLPIPPTALRALGRSSTV